MDFIRRINLFDKEIKQMPINWEYIKERQEDADEIIDIVAVLKEALSLCKSEIERLEKRVNDLNLSASNINADKHLLCHLNNITHIWFDQNKDELKKLTPFTFLKQRLASLKEQEISIKLDKIKNNDLDGRFSLLDVED